jgi:hypothetical protein
MQDWLRMAKEWVGKHKERVANIKKDSGGAGCNYSNLVPPKGIIQNFQTPRLIPLLALLPEDH